MPNTTGKKTCLAKMGVRQLLFSYHTHKLLSFFYYCSTVKKTNKTFSLPTSTACACYAIPVCHNTHAVSIVQSVCVNCRSAGQKDNGQQGLCCPARPSLPLYVAFPSVQIIIWACVSVPWLTALLHTHARTAATHTKKQKHAHNHITITQNFTGIGNEALFFRIWWPVATFPLSTTEPNIQEICIQLGTTQSQGLRGVFIWL